ncbi:MAG TPA: hypothetical protein PK568_05725 [Bacillota bacterium]|jgi:hypothetical protein|nr:hypothetical protein [Bacillota bacterium]
MCKPKTECEHPERRPKDGKCSEELIKECHGEKKEKSCCDTKKDE